MLASLGPAPSGLVGSGLECSGLDCSGLDCSGLSELMGISISAEQGFKKKSGRWFGSDFISATWLA
jgi:hypothetical protein